MQLGMIGLGRMGAMAAYAEGLNILEKANIGKRDRALDAETTPLRNAEHYQYDLNVAAITELWRRGSVIASWLLDLTAKAFAENPTLDGFAGTVADSGEGRWTIAAATDEAVPIVDPVLQRSSPLYEYDPGSWGPSQADALAAAVGGWNTPAGRP